jgi:tetratricopeptide (TPR) repeat protein
VYKDLANAHYFKNNYKQAKKWYEKLFDTEPTKDLTLKFRYKQSLKALGLFTEDNKYLSNKTASTN